MERRPGQEDQPPDKTNGDPFTIARQGEDVTRTVPPRNLIFVHYKMPTDSGISQVNATISTS